MFTGEHVCVKFALIRFSVTTGVFFSHISWAVYASHSGDKADFVNKADSQEGLCGIANYPSYHNATWVA